MNGRFKSFGLVLVGAVAGILVSLNFQAIGQLATRSPLPVEELRYWNVDRQEPYAGPEAKLLRLRQLGELPEKP